MVDDQKADRLDVDWTVRLNQVQRLAREEGDEGEVFYDVEFELHGPGLTGTLSTLITDPASEEAVITEGFDLLRIALEEFAAAVRQRMKPIPTETAKG